MVSIAFWSVVGFALVFLVVYYYAVYCEHRLCKTLDELNEAIKALTAKLKGGQ